MTRDDSDPNGSDPNGSDPNDSDGSTPQRGRPDIDSGYSDADEQDAGSGDPPSDGVDESAVEVIATGDDQSESVSDDGESEGESEGESPPPEVVFDEISLDQLSADILLTVANTGGEATTTDIREATGVDTNRKVIYRVEEHLEPNDLVDIHQPEPDGGGFPPKQITLTRLGEQYVDHYQRANDPDELSRVQTQLRALRTRMEELEAENEQLQAENRALREQVDASAFDSSGSGDASQTADNSSADDLTAKVSDIIQQIEERSGVSFDEIDERIVELESQVDETHTEHNRDYNDLQRRIDELADRVETLESDTQAAAAGSGSAASGFESHPLIANDAGIDLLNRTFAVGNTVQQLLVNNTSVTQQQVRERYSEVFDQLEQQEQLLEPTGRSGD